MKEYTLIAICSLVVTIFIDRFLKANILRKKEFYLFILIILLFKLLVNGYLTGREIVLYNPRFFLGVRAGSIPLEDFIFGFSMVALTIIFWERFRREGQ